MILVTGCSGPLGAAIAMKLASQGHNLLIHTHQSIESVTDIAQVCHQKHVHVQCVSWDFRNMDECLKQYAQLDRMLTGFVYTVGPYLENPPSRMIKNFEALLPLELLAPVALTEAFLPALQHTQGGIIYLGVAGLKRCWQTASAYYVLKQSLWLYAEALAKELAAQRIQVNMVSPGHLPGSIPLKDAEQLPQKRVIQQEEIADMIGYLFSSSARSITGQNIEIAGGVGL